MVSEPIPSARAGQPPAEPVVVAGRCDLLDLLGQGGMARVYRARDRQLGHGAPWRTGETSSTAT